MTLWFNNYSCWVDLPSLLATSFSVLAQFLIVLYLGRRVIKSCPLAVLGGLLVTVFILGGFIAFGWSRYITFYGPCLLKVVMTLCSLIVAFKTKNKKIRYSLLFLIALMVPYLFRLMLIIKLHLYPG